MIADEFTITDLTAGKASLFDLAAGVIWISLVEFA